jgi:hypothetical protein
MRDPDELEEGEDDDDGVEDERYHLDIGARGEGDEE